MDVEDRTALETTCVDQAKALLERHRTIAVVVNRVASASVIARQLDETLGPDATITLLTGRMRPLDRDDVLRELRPAVQTGRERATTARSASSSARSASRLAQTSTSTPWSLRPRASTACGSASVGSIGSANTGTRKA
ncbi:MAG: hypothetical protein IPK20_16340 [Betaproteobacteria bacterium]|nr:hypothetical protein [Betaproteobacteria bacterium]